jgi:hypothetical protein
MTTKQLSSGMGEYVAGIFADSRIRMWRSNSFDAGCIDMFTTNVNYLT